MARNSLQNITPEQPENKKFQDYLEQIQGIQDSFKALGLWEKAFSLYFLKLFCPSQ